MDALDLDELVEVKSLQKHLFSDETKKKRIHLWDKYFEKYEKLNRLADSDGIIDGECSEEQQTDDTETSTSMDDKNTKNSVLGRSSNSKTTNQRKSLVEDQLKSCQEIKTRKQRIRKNKENSSCVPKISDKAPEEVKTISRDDFLKHRFEVELGSDLNVKLFKRRRSQVENNETDFVYWNNEVKKELQNLSGAVTIQDLQMYMESSLLALISQYNVKLK